ncbi:MAG TPA: ABC transporter permease [Terriglobales bacterium]|nr:ABC transporter permease [Terriglobales bacterium]
MRRLLQDVRFSTRVLRKNPSFTVAAVITLAIGIGANTAVFSVTNALLLRPFPFHDPQSLLAINTTDKTSDRPTNLVRYEFLRDHNQSFESMAGWTNDDLNFTGRGEPLQLPVARVSPNFFSMLGVEPQLGRGYREEEGRPEGKPVAILSDPFWRKQFGSDPEVIGQTITLDTTPYTVIGVLPASVQFAFVGDADIWIPRYFEFSLMTPQQLRSGAGYLGMVARLRPEATLAHTQAELDVLNQQYRNENPKMPDTDPAISIKAEPLRDVVVSDMRGKALFLSAAVGLVLLIACGNVATFLLSRALARRKEIAVRTALGASRSVLIRQLLVESIMLSVVAATAGVSLGWGAVIALAKWGTSQLPQGIPINIDLRVLLFTAVVSLLTGLVFGSFPALHLSRVDPNSTLRNEGRGLSASRARARLTNSLVVGQIALSLVLLISAGLLLRSFLRLLNIDPGFDTRNVLTMNISLPTAKYAKPEQQIAFFDGLLRRVSALPGVRDAAVSAALPLHWIRVTPVLPEGQPDVPLPQRPFIDIEAVSAKWFSTMRVPLRAGRGFTLADDAQAPKVVIANETFARRFWPNQNPIGKHVVIGRRPEPAEVVGIAADIKNKGLAEDTQAQLYLPFPQLPWGEMNLLVRTAVPPESMTQATRAQVASLDPDQPVVKIQTVDDLMDTARAQPRFTTALLASFSLTALLLAIIGIYGVLAYSVAQRCQELGVRFALGAAKSDILRLVVSQGFKLALIGTGIGLVAALLLTRLMSSLLYKVRVWDRMTFVAAPGLLLLTALLASYFPARGAANVDPTEALKEA